MSGFAGLSLPGKRKQGVTASRGHGLSLLRGCAVLVVGLAALIVETANRLQMREVVAI